MSAKYYLNSHPLEVLSRYRDPQLQVGEDFLYLFNLRLILRFNIVGSLRDREEECWGSDRQGSNFKFCLWRAVSSHSSYQPQEVSWPSLAYICTKVA